MRVTRTGLGVPSLSDRIHSNTLILSDCRAWAYHTSLSIKRPGTCGTQALRAHQIVLVYTRHLRTAPSCHMMTGDLRVTTKGHWTSLAAVIFSRASWSPSQPSRTGRSLAAWSVSIHGKALESFCSRICLHIDLTLVSSRFCRVMWPTASHQVLGVILALYSWGQSNLTSTQSASIRVGYPTRDTSGRSAQIFSCTWARSSSICWH